ncbi:MAG: hypothetical protein WAX89_04905 [Alphaproteobacteria bacterium]
MTNRETTLLITTVIFLSTTIGLGFQAMHQCQYRGWKGHHSKHAERHAEMFKKADTNADGFLTLEEMAANHQQRMVEMFTTLDADKDNRLSATEMAEARNVMREKMKQRWAEKAE